MKLSEIQIRNFMPYKGEQVVKFPDDPTQNVMLLFGDNMRGKTSFLNALRWAFYGKALGRHLREIPFMNLLNSDARDEGDWIVEVGVVFDEDSHRYDLRRQMKKRDVIAVPKSNSDFEVSLALRVDGTPIVRDQIEYQINQVIPEQISRFFLFDGELLQEYETLVLETSEQGSLIKEKIEQVLGVPALTNGRDEIETLLKKAMKQQAKDTRHIEALKSHSDRLVKLQAESVSHENDLSSLKDNFQKTKDEIEKIEDELDAAHAALDVQAKFNQNKDRLKELESEEVEIREEIITSLRDIWRDVLQPRLLIKISQLESEKDEIHGWMQQQGVLKSKIEGYQSLLDTSLCPTCEQQVPEKAKLQFAREIEKLKSEVVSISGNSGSLDRISSEINDLKAIMPSGDKEKIVINEKALVKINIEITKIENQNKELEEKIKGYDTVELERKRTKLEILQKNAGKSEFLIAEKEEEISKNTKEQEKISALMSKDPLGRKNRSSLQVDICKNIASVFSESISRLRDELRESVQELATSAFEKLTTEKEYAGLSINENYGLKILDSKGRELEERSAGAEQIVALSLISGLNEVARKTGPIVMDTPLARLDLKHRQRVLEYLPTMAEQVVLLVHEGEISKEEVAKPLENRIGSMWEIERISASQSRLTRL